jgi:translation elongation factor EF-Ts
VKDPDKSVNDLLAEAGLQMREKIAVRRFVRFQLGESLDPKSGPA